MIQNLFLYWLVTSGLLLSNVSAQTNDPLSSCTQTNTALLDACIASALDHFLSTLDAANPTTFDYSSVASQINSLQSGLTSVGVTLTSSLPDPASFTSMASTYSGPYVSDIASSYSQYTATRTDSSGSAFSFDTSSFQATAGPSSTTSTSRSSSTVTSARSSNGALESGPRTTASEAGATTHSGVVPAGTMLGFVMMVMAML